MVVLLTEEVSIIAFAGWRGCHPADLHGQGLLASLGDGLPHRGPSLHGEHDHQIVVITTIITIITIGIENQQPHQNIS